jgi:putative membrane protein
LTLLRHRIDSAFAGRQGTRRDHEKFTAARSRIRLGFECVTAFAADHRLSSQDNLFINTTAEAGHAEVAAGNIAGARSSSDAIRKFADQMVQDHTKAGDELAMIAQKKAVTLPVEPDAIHQNMVSQLSKTDVSNFDRLYIDEAGVKDHKAAVSSYRDEAMNGSDAELKAFAPRILPAVEHHYQLAKEVSKTVDKK